MKKNPRGQAAEILERWLKTGAFPDRLLEDVAENRAFIMEIVYGVARRKRALEWILRRFAKRAPPRALLPYMLTGLYQIFFLDNVAEYAAVSETVELVKGRFARAHAEFANAVMRNAARQKQAVMEALRRQPPALRESHPDALFNRWAKARGPQFAEQMCEWDNRRSETVIRINLAAVDAARFRAALAEAKIKAVPHPAAPELFFRLPRGAAIPDIPGYKKGWFAVLDPASALPVELLDVRPGLRVLDACAAPGGKTFLIAEKLRACGELCAMDKNNARLELLRENMCRLGYAWVKITCGDATKLHEKKDRPYDRILVDAPCSNTGVLRRRADARWNFSERKLKELAAQQLEILCSAAAALAPGGRMVYSTCSIEPEENEMVVSRFLKARPDFKLAASRISLPPESGIDGGFAALLERR